MVEICLETIDVCIWHMFVVVGGHCLKIADFLALDC